MSDFFSMKQFKTFTGGPLETNAYFLETEGGNVLFDAPEGADARFAGSRIDWLVLTHGHFDHTADAAKIQRRHHCKIAYHRLTAPMVTRADFFHTWGYPITIDPFQADRILEECESCDIVGATAKILHVPGHSPDSLCFYFPAYGTLVGGDVLFRGGVGRWDLPGGDGEALFEGIRKKVSALDGATVALPGHEPATTVEIERKTNPYVAG